MCLNQESEADLGPHGKSMGGQTMMTANATDFLGFPQGRPRKVMDGLVVVTNDEGPQARTGMGPRARVRVKLTILSNNDLPMSSPSIEQPPNSR